MATMTARSMALMLSVSMAALQLQGCAGGIPGTSGFEVSASDVCRYQRQQLRSIEDYFSRALIEGAVGGALAGGLAGGLIGGDVKGALIGAAAGAALGAAANYYAARQKASSDRTVLVQTVYKDLSTENEQIDQTTAYFRGVRECRLNAANQIRNDLQAGRIGRELAQTRMVEQQQLFLQEIAYTESLGGKISERGDSFVYASNEMIKEDPNAQRIAQQRRAQEQAYYAPPPVPQQPDLFYAQTPVRVHNSPAESSGQVGLIQRNERVDVVQLSTGPNGRWSRVRMANGNEGFVRSELLGRQAAPAQVAQPQQPRPQPRPQRPPPQDTAGVVQLTESNQVKRQGLTDEVGQAKNLASTAFTLDRPVSSLRLWSPLG